MECQYTSGNWPGASAWRGTSGIAFHVPSTQAWQLERGAGEILLAAVELVQGRRCEQLYGTCQPSNNLYQAVVYAVLDALNRRLEMMLFKSAQEAEY